MQRPSPRYRTAYGRHKGGTRAAQGRHKGGTRAFAAVTSGGLSLLSLSLACPRLGGTRARTSPSLPPSLFSSPSPPPSLSLRTLPLSQARQRARTCSWTRPPTPRFPAESAHMSPAESGPRRESGSVSLRERVRVSEGAGPCLSSRDMNRGRDSDETGPGRGGGACSVKEGERPCAAGDRRGRGGGVQSQALLYLSESTIHQNK